MAISRTLFLSDLHFGQTDFFALDVVLRCIEFLQPEHIVLAGDVLDFNSLSSFDHNPLAETLSQELAEWFAFAAKLRAAAGAAEIGFFEGNHENRLKRFIWRNPALFGVEALSLRSLMQLDKWGINYHENEIWVAGGNLCLTHGTCTGQYPAAAELRKCSHGFSGVSGHVHRFSTSMATQRIGADGDYMFKGWYSVGCLCSLKPEYVSGTANWQQGFATVYQTDGDHFTVVPSLILGRKTLIEGREIRA